MSCMSELLQDFFVPEEFVESLAWRTIGNDSSGVLQLYNIFIQKIKDLACMHESQKKKCEIFKQKCKEEEKKHCKIISILIESNKTAAYIYKSLDEKISSVATKVVHLGNQLYSINTPRNRNSDTLKIIKHFDEFLLGETLFSALFYDKLYEAAETILKLYLIVQELPSDKFGNAIKNTEKKYIDIEKRLIDEFIKAISVNDISKMKNTAYLLSYFKGYNHCIDSFIEKIQYEKLSSNNIFEEIIPLCQSSWKIINEVFPNPCQVMGKFVLNIYHHRLKDYFSIKLSSVEKTDKFLDEFCQMYSQVLKLTEELGGFSFGTEEKFLSNLVKTAFRSYLESYIELECKHLNKSCNNVLKKYYKHIGHQKKQAISSIGSEKLQDFKRDLQVLIYKTNNHSYQKETFLSEEVAINILQLTKASFDRCSIISNPKNVSSNTTEIYTILINFLLQEHVAYGIDISLQGLSNLEIKNIQNINFFDTLRQTTAIMHLFEKNINLSVLPLVTSTNKYNECSQKKKLEFEKLEQKLHSGIIKTLNLIINCIKNILINEQKKVDFNPLPAKNIATTSNASLKVVKFVEIHLKKIRESMDGYNLDCVLLFFGVQFHKAIYDHLLQFNYNSLGAMSAICDVQEYRKCASKFKIDPVNALFDTLYAMCNLLILPPSNIRVAMNGDQLVNIDPTILDNWIQLRVDYKIEKLGNNIFRF